MHHRSESRESLYNKTRVGSTLFLWPNKIGRDERKRTFTMRMKNRFGIYDIIVPENESNMKKIKGSSVERL